MISEVTRLLREYAAKSWFIVLRGPRVLLADTLVLQTRETAVRQSAAEYHGGKDRVKNDLPFRDVAGGQG